MGAITHLNLKYFAGLISCSIVISLASKLGLQFPWQSSWFKFASPPDGPHLDTLGAGGLNGQRGCGFREELCATVLFWLRAGECRPLLLYQDWGLQKPPPSALVAKWYSSLLKSPLKCPLEFRSFPWPPKVWVSPCHILWQHSVPLVSSHLVAVTFSSLAVL